MPGTLDGAGLAAVRGGRAVFAGLGFALAPGGALLLTGPNGSGKSTLLRLIAGFGHPVAGQIAWNGGAIADDMEAHRARLHYVGHQDGLKPALTVGETVRFWRALAGRDRADEAAALAAVGLAALAELPCRFLSAGQRRRVALARLALWPAPLWLLDEPTVGLDAAALALLEALCRRHRAEGGSIVAASHQAFGLDDTATLSLGDFAPAPVAAGW
ncbi:MAG TPA: heme ABC exporter ATP-binding protein CcmA [Stellaceae bacterium]|nr:heme ABC exporter ATP-binding protein CcmA [Stellaceae bacterium]